MTIVLRPAEFHRVTASNHGRKGDLVGYARDGYRIKAWLNQWVVVNCAMVWMIRLLRKLPHSEAFDRHLTDCAFAVIWNDEKLTLRKLFRFEPLAPLYGVAELTEDDIRRSYELAKTHGWH